jgi:hypothetical protein
MANVGAALRPDDVRGDAKTDLAVGRAPIMPIACAIYGQDGDLVAEESSGPRWRMGEQGLGFGELQLDRDLRTFRGTKHVKRVDVQ